MCWLGECTNITIYCFTKESLIFWGDLVKNTTFLSLTYFLVLLVGLGSWSCLSGMCWQMVYRRKAYGNQQVTHSSSFRLEPSLKWVTHEISFYNFVTNIQHLNYCHRSCTVLWVWCQQVWVWPCPKFSPGSLSPGLCCTAWPKPGSV